MSTTKDKPLRLLDANGQPIEKTEEETEEKPSPIQRMGWTGKSKYISIRGNVSPTVNDYE